MGTSNLDRLSVSILVANVDNPQLPDIRYHQCYSSSSSSSSSSQTPDATNDDSHKAQNLNLVSGALKLQVPSSDGEFKVSDGEDAPETPRSIEHKIPVTAACPPAPRKARRVPVSGKRKPTGPFFPVVRVPADFIVYMDAMLALNEAVYVPDIVVGDLGNWHHAKRMKL